MYRLIESIWLGIRLHASIIIKELSLLDQSTELLCCIVAVSKQPAVESAYGGWHGTKNVSEIKLAKDTASLLEKSTFGGCFFNNSMRELVCIWRVGIFAFFCNTKITLSINLTRGSYSALGVCLEKFWVVWRFCVAETFLSRKMSISNVNVRLATVGATWSQLHG